MSYHYTDFVHTKSFTPKEAQVELCDAAARDNTIVSFINQPGKNFICSQIIQYFVNYGCGKKVLYVINAKNNAKRHADAIKRLSCHIVVENNAGDEESLKGAQIIVSSVNNALSLLEQKLLGPADIGLFVLHECHKIVDDEAMQKVRKREVNVCRTAKFWKLQELGDSLTNQYNTIC